MDWKPTSMLGITAALIVGLSGSANAHDACSSDLAGQITTRGAAVDVAPDENFKAWHAEKKRVRKAKRRAQRRYRRAMRRDDRTVVVRDFIELSGDGTPVLCSIDWMRFTATSVLIIPNSMPGSNPMASRQECSCRL